MSTVLSAPRPTTNDRSQPVEQPVSIPLIDPDVKRGRAGQALFNLFSGGLVTNREEWGYDRDPAHLATKTQRFVAFYEEERMRWREAALPKQALKGFLTREIKWTDELKEHLLDGGRLFFDPSMIRPVQYRPLVKQHGYVDQLITHRLGELERVWGLQEHHLNQAIVFTPGSLPFATDAPIDHAYGARGTVAIPLFRYDEHGVRHDNITDQGLQRFRAHYGPQPSGSLGHAEDWKMPVSLAAARRARDNGLRVPSLPAPPAAEIDRTMIFHYVYAVLHDPVQRTYAGAEGDVPMIPLHADVLRWSVWGKKLFDLHLGFETVETWPLEVATSLVRNGRGTHNPTGRQRTRGTLRLDPTNELIELDRHTLLRDIPNEAWNYVLGDRSALAHVADAFRDRAPRTRNAPELFDTYRFADHKERAIMLLKRACTVSMRTLAIMREMQQVVRVHAIGFFTYAAASLIVA